MQIFISYRREDTAGRAGRLFDALVGRFGERNVFQDVAAIAPGSDFDQAISAAIDRCDVALVVIGAEWATLAGPAGRRLDEPGDYVRREVAAALAADVPVVPVLVDGAAMPSAAQLPDDLEPLARRQAVAIRDESWHQDIDALVRRLQHDEVAGPDTRHRLGALLVAGGIVAVLVAAALGLWLSRDDGSGGGPSSDEAITGCPAPRPAWQDLPVGATASATGDVDGSSLEFTVRSVSLDRQEDQLFLDVEVRNVTDPASQAVPYLNEALFRTVLIDGLAQGDAWCLTVEGDPNLRPGQRAVGLVGYDLNDDPTGRPLVLALLMGDPQITITS